MPDVFDEIGEEAPSTGDIFDQISEEEAPQQPAKPWTPSLPPDVQHQMIQEFAQAQLVRDPAQPAIKQQEAWYRSRGLEPPKTPEQVIEEKVKKASMTGEEMQALGLPKWLAPIERGVAETAGAFSQPENLAWMGAAGVPGVGRVMGGAFMGQIAEQSTEEIVGGAADILKGNTEQGLQRITSGLTQGAAVAAPFGVGKAREMLSPTPEFQGPLATGEALVMPPGARAPVTEATAPETVSPEVAARQAAQMTREATATAVERPAGALPPEVPATPPEPQRGLTVIEEIRRAGARTTAQVQALFPERNLTRQEAAAFRRDAWGEAPPEPAPKPIPDEPPPTPEPVPEEPKGSSFLGQTKDVWTPEYLADRLAEEGNRRAIVNGINAAPELKRRVALKPEARPETILKAIHDLIDVREKVKAEAPPAAAPEAPAESPQAKAKSVLIQRRIKEGIPPENIQIVVNKDPAVPDFGFVQVDEIHPERGNVFSSNAEQMRELGYDMPSQEELMDLPAGKYRLPEVRNMLVAKKLGVRYRGTQMGRDQYAWDDPKAAEGMPSVVDFSVPAGTGEEGVAARLAERRAQYEESTGAPTEAPKAEAKPAETTAIPEALSKVAYLATYENGRFLHEARSRLTEAERKEVSDWAVKNNVGDPNQPQTEEAFFSKLAKYASDQTKPAETPAAAAAKVEQELQPGRITTEEVPRTTKGAKQAKTILIRELQKLHKEAPKASEVHAIDNPAEKVTIDIPGDGEFTVWKTKENLELLIKRAKRISTSAEGKATVPKGAVASSERALDKPAEYREEGVKAQRQALKGKARIAMADAINQATNEGIIAYHEMDLDPVTDQKRMKEWQIRKPTTEERTEYWKASRKEIGWIVDSRIVKFDEQGRRQEGEWGFATEGRTRADAIRSAEHDVIPPGAVLTNEGLNRWRDLENETGAFSYISEGKEPTPAAPTPPEGKGLAGEVRKRLAAGEQPGSTAGGGQLHAMLFDFGKSVYQKGMDFAQWSARMVKELGENVREWLRDIWLNVMHGPPADAMSVAKEFGYTHNPEPQFAGVSLKGLSPEDLRKLRVSGRRPSWEFTDRRGPGNTDTPGHTFYTRVGASRAEIMDHLNACRKARGLPPVGEATPTTLELEAGAGIPIPRVLTDTLKKTRDTLKTMWQTRDVSTAMTYLRDAADNVATVYSQRVGNNVRGQLRRVMGRGKTANPLDENALTFVREADGDRSQLAVMRAKLTASTRADPKWTAEALKAIDHADGNWDRLNPIAQKYEQATDRQIEMENAAGINTLSRKGYVMHAQDVDSDFGYFTDVAGQGTSGFKHVRTHETFADSIAAGVDPKSLNAVVLLTQRVARGQRLINTRMWVEGLRATTDPQTGKSVVTEPEIIKRDPGLPPDMRAPKDYVLEFAGARPIAVLKSYSGVFRALTEPSKFSESLGWNMALKAATTGKHIALMLDTFHLGRIAFWESVIKPLSFTDPKLPLPSYKRGVLTLDYSPAELQRMANAGEIDPAHLSELLQAQRDVNGLLKHGYNLAKISDQLHQEWLQQIPVTGAFNRWLFNQFQRGAMAEVGAMEVPRYRRMHPSWTDEQVYREVSKDLNTRFGNMGRQGIFKSKTAQDTARLAFLAPQWNEGLLRSEAGAITGLGKGVVSSVKEGRPSFGILPRAVGAMLLGQFAANQIINFATRGKPTWENEEEGIGAKLSAWIPDLAGKGSGFFLHPAGLAAEVTHLLSQKYAKKGDFYQALMSFMGGRWSTLARPVVTALSRRDIFQRLIRPENIWTETGKAAIPTPIGASAAVPAIRGAFAGESKEPYPGAYQRQMMSSMGIKTDIAESPGQRISALAHNWRKSQGIVDPGEFYESAYAPLRNALRRGALKEGQQAYDDLLKTHTPDQIDKAIKPWTGGTVDRRTFDYRPRKQKPLTGSAKHETEFLATLTPEQKRIYALSQQERAKEYQTFQAMLRERPAKDVFDTITE